MTGDEAVVTVGLAAGIGMVARTAESLPFAVSAPPPLSTTHLSQQSAPMIIMYYRELSKNSPTNRKATIPPLCMYK